MKLFNLIFLLVTTLLLSVVASAGAITGVTYNSQTKILGLHLAYEGQTNNHEFSLLWDACEVVNGENQIAARLIDAQGDEHAGETFEQYVEFDLADVGCKPADLTVRWGRRSHQNIRID